MRLWTRFLWTCCALLLLWFSVMAASQQADKRDVSYWLGVARDAEQRNDSSTVYRAYCEALALQPENPHLNLKVLQLRLQARNLQNAEDYVIRATQGFLKNPQAYVELAGDLAELLMGDIPESFGDLPLDGRYLIITPFYQMPDQLKRQAMQTLPHHRLFRNPFREVLAWLSLGEKENAARRLEELVLEGLIDSGHWSAMQHNRLVDVRWLRALARQWEESVQRKPNVRLLQALLDLNWHLMNVPALRRLLPLMQKVAKEDEQFAKWCTDWLERSGWLEGKKAFREETTVSKPPQRPLSLQAELKEAVQSGDLDHARRVLFEIAAQERDMDVAVAQDSMLCDMLANGWHELVKRIFPEDANLYLTGTLVATQLLEGTVFQDREFDYWLDRLHRQDASKCAGVVLSAARTLDNSAPEQAIWVLERALPRFPGNRDMTQLLSDLYRRTGYGHRAQRLQTASTTLHVTEPLPLPAPDGGEPSSPAPANDLRTQIEEAEGKLRHASVTGAPQEQLLQALLETAALYARLPDGTSRARQQAESLLPLHPEWREGFVKAEAMFRRGVQAVVPFTLWLNDCVLENLSAPSMLETLQRIGGRTLTVALALAIAVTLDRRQDSPVAELDLNLLLPPEDPSAPVSPMPPNPFEELSPADRQALVKQLTPDLWHPNLFLRTRAGFHPAFFKAMKQAYPNAAGCILHELAMETLWSPAGASSEALLRAAERLKRATHWNSFNWERLQDVLNSARAYRRTAEAIALIQAVIPHAPAQVVPLLKRQLLVCETIQLLEKLQNAQDKKIAARVKELREQLLADEGWSYERVQLLQQLASVSPETSLALLAEILPDMFICYPANRTMPLTHLNPALNLLEQIASEHPSLRERASALTQEILDYAEAVAPQALNWQNRAWVSALARTGRKSRAVRLLEENLKRPAAFLPVVVDLTLETELTGEMRSQIRTAVVNWLVRRRVGMSMLADSLAVSHLGRLSTYSVREGRQVYYIQPNSQGVALWAEILTDYLSKYPTLIPLDPMRRLLSLIGSIYQRDDLRDALPAWRKLLRTLLDKLAQNPEDLQALAPELLRTVAPVGSAPSDFATEVTHLIREREGRSSP